MVMKRTWAALTMLLVIFTMSAIADDVEKWIQDLNDSGLVVREAAAEPLSELNDTSVVEPLIQVPKNNTSGGPANATLALESWSHFLDVIAANLFTALKITVFTLILLTIIFIFLKIYIQKGIVILPFEIEQNTNISGAAIADQLTAELVRIQRVHSVKFEDLTLTLTRGSFFVSELSAETLLNNSQLIVPKTEIVEFNLVDIGDINMGIGSLSIGKLVIAFKGICPGCKPVTTIRGSLQKYGSTIVLVAILESRTIQSWMLELPIDKNEEQIHEMIKNLAAMITHGLQLSGLSAKSWEGLKHYTNALDAYYQYNLSRNLDVLSLASDYSLKAIESEKNYKNPYDLLSLLEFAYIDNERPNDAEKYCNKTIELDPSSPYAWLNKGRVLDSLSRLDEAFQAYDEAIKRDPECARAWTNKGAIFEEKGKYDEAIQAYDEAIKRDPKYDMPWYDKGTVLERKGKHDEAIQAYDEAIKLNPKFFHAWDAKGDVLSKKGKYDEAIQAFDEAIKLNPKFFLAWGAKGDVLSKKGKYDEAIQAFDEAIKLNPKFFLAWDAKGSALGKKGKYDEAIQAFDEAIKLNPECARAWTNKGAVLSKKGKYDEAIQAFDEAIKLNPNNATIWNNKGWTLYTIRKYDESLEAANRSLELDPEKAHAWDTKGAALFGLGKYAEAIECYDRAIELDKIRPGVVWHHKGEAFNALGRTVEANAAFAKAEKLGYTGKIPDSSWCM